MMRYEQAQQLAREMNCRHALAVALRATNDIVPPPSIDAIVVCKKKIRQGIEPYDCTPLLCYVWDVT